MTNKEFAERLTKLRIEKGVSARDMSLTLGLSATYINRIENGRMMPSMSVFFDICDYFMLTPAEFFYIEQNASADALHEHAVGGVGHHAQGRAVLDGSD